MLTRTSTDTGPACSTAWPPSARVTRPRMMDDALIAMAQERRRHPLELVVFVTARFDAAAQSALDAWARRAATLVVVTGGLAPRSTGATRVVDARDPLRFPTLGNAARNAAPKSSRAQGPASTPRPQSDMELRRDVVPAVALAALSAAVAAGFARVFSGDSWLAPVLAAAIAPHVIGLLTRRRPVVVTVGAWAARPRAVRDLGAAPSSTTVRNPHRRTRSTSSAIASITVSGCSAISRRRCHRTPGAVLLAVITVWVMAAFADHLAFRRNATIGAVAPGITLFIWIAALAPGADSHVGPRRRSWITGVRVPRAPEPAPPRAPTQRSRRRRRRCPPRAWWPARSSLGVVAAIVAVAVAPSLPGRRRRSVGRPAQRTTTRRRRTRPRSRRWSTWPTAFAAARRSRCSPSRRRRRRTGAPSRSTSTPAMTAVSGPGRVGRRHHPRPRRPGAAGAQSSSSSASPHSVNGGCRPRTRR